MRLRGSIIPIILFVGLTAGLVACGGGSDSATSTDCVIGSSAIGECKIR